MHVFKTIFSQIKVVVEEFINSMSRDFDYDIYYQTHPEGITVLCCFLPYSIDHAFKFNLTYDELDLYDLVENVRSKIDPVSFKNYIYKYFDQLSDEEAFGSD